MYGTAPPDLYNPAPLRSPSTEDKQQSRLSRLRSDSSISLARTPSRSSIARTPSRSSLGNTGGGVSERGNSSRREGKRQDLWKAQQERRKPKINNSFTPESDRLRSQVDAGQWSDKERVMRSPMYVRFGEEEASPELHPGHFPTRPSTSHDLEVERVMRYRHALSMETSALADTATALPDLSSSTPVRYRSRRRRKYPNHVKNLNLSKVYVKVRSEYLEGRRSAELQPRATSVQPRQQKPTMIRYSTSPTPGTGKAPRAHSTGPTTVKATLFENLRMRDAQRLSRSKHMRLYNELTPADFRRYSPLRRSRYDYEDKIEAEWDKWSLELLKCSSIEQRKMLEKKRDDAIAKLRAEENEEIGKRAAAECRKRVKARHDKIVGYHEQMMGRLVQLQPTSLESITLAYYLLGEDGALSTLQKKGPMQTQFNDPGANPWQSPMKIHPHNSKVFTK